MSDRAAECYKRYQRRTAKHLWSYGGLKVIGFKLDLFELIEGIRDGIFSFVGNFLWSISVLIRHPVRGPSFLAARFVASRRVQMGPFTFVTTLIFLSLLLIASIGQFPVDDELTTLSGQPVKTSLTDYLDLLSTPNAVVLLLSAALFAALLQGGQKFFFRRLAVFTSKRKLEWLLASLGFSTLYAAILGFLSLSALMPLTFFGLLVSGNVEFLGAGKTNGTVVFLTFGLTLLISVVIGSLPAVTMVRRIMIHGQKTGTFSAMPLSRSVTVFRCAAPYILAYLATGAVAQISFPDEPRIWISHVICEPHSDRLSANFIISNQTSVDVLIPRYYFELEFTSDHDGMGGAAGAGLVSALLGVAHNIKGDALFTIEGTKADQTAIHIGSGKTYHGSLELKFNATQISDLPRFRAHIRGTACRIHAPNNPGAEMVSTSQFEYQVDPPADQPTEDE